VTMQPNERQMAVLPVRAFEKKFVFFATEKGIVKKTPLSAFANPRPSGIQAITLDPDDAVVKASLTGGNDEIVLGTRLGMVCRFRESEVRAMGRTARGVRGITLDRDDCVVDMIVVQPGMSVLTVCQNGYGKRTPVEEYRLTHRGSKGVINIRVTERNGPVIALRAVTDEDSLMLITAQGNLLRMELSELRDIGRATQGVRLIRVEEGDSAVAVAKVVSEKEEKEIDEGGPEFAGPGGIAEPGPATAEDNASGVSTEPDASEEQQPDTNT